MKKNKQVLEFSNIIEQVDKTTFDYEMTRNMFLDFLEFVNKPWNEYVDLKTKKEIMDDYKYFSQYIYMPF
jgi:hypothetical protein